MERKSAWKTYDDEQLAEVNSFADDYIDFISTCKTERECTARAVELARKAGYISLDEARVASKQLKAGDRVYATNYGKAIMLVQVGSDPMENGFNILGAHIDSPRLDVKQNPLYEQGDLAYLDTHYYGGIKKYQWVTLPLAIHGVVVKEDGTKVQVNVGEDAADPVFCVTDLLIHLGGDQMQKKAAKVIEGEDLDVLVGHKPLVVSKEDAKNAAEGSIEETAAKTPIKAALLQLFQSKYDFGEDDFLSAELEVVPAGRARSCGFDRSMILGYGQDDRSCAYPSLVAQLGAGDLKRTGICFLTDKEEIGSVGATGMTSLFFENTVAEIMELAGEGGDLKRRHALARSNMLSSDVSAGLDPLYASAFDEKNAAHLGFGLVFNKFTGSRGKSGSNDANAEYIAHVRDVMRKGGVTYHTSELGKVDQGGGGTIAYILAKYDMNVIDSGVSVLSMHAPWEVTSKADIYEAKKGYTTFLQYA